MKIHLTRRSKIISGVIVVLVVAVLIMGFGTGLPGTGLKLVGSVTTFDTNEIALLSDWLGAATGVLTVTNVDGETSLILRGYKHIQGSYFFMGEDILGPLETRAYDYKGFARVVFNSGTWGDTVQMWAVLPGRISYIRSVGNYQYFSYPFATWTERGSGGGAGNRLNLR